MFPKYYCQSKSDMDVGGVQPIPNQTLTSLKTDPKNLVRREIHCSSATFSLQSFQKESHLTEEVIQQINTRLWCSYRALGNELSDLAEMDGHKLGTKSKDSSRAVVSCARSGSYTPTGKQRVTSTKKCGCLYKIDLKRGESLWLTCSSSSRLNST
jgi:hypothetical protein